MQLLIAYTVVSLENITNSMWAIYSLSNHLTSCTLNTVLTLSCYCKSTEHFKFLSAIAVSDSYYYILFMVLETYAQFRPKEKVNWWVPCLNKLCAMFGFYIWIISPSVYYYPQFHSQVNCSLNNQSTAAMSAVLTVYIAHDHSRPRNRPISLIPNARACCRVPTLPVPRCTPRSYPCLSSIHCDHLTTSANKCELS